MKRRIKITKKKVQQVTEAVLAAYLLQGRKLPVNITVHPTALPWTKEFPKREGVHYVAGFEHVQGLHVTARERMANSWENVDTVLKQLFLPAIQKQLAESTALWTTIAKEGNRC